MTEGIELWDGRNKSIETWARATGLSIEEVKWVAELPREKWPAVAYLAVCLQATGRADHSVTAIAQELCEATGGHRSPTTGKATLRLREE